VARIGEHARTRSASALVIGRRPLRMPGILGAVASAARDLRLRSGAPSNRSTFREYEVSSGASR